MQIAAVSAIIATAILFSCDPELGNAIRNIVRERIVGGNLATWWNPHEETQVRSLNNNRKLTTWSTGFTKGALLIGCPDKIPHNYNTEIVPIEERQYPDKEKETYVGWDQGKVVDLSLEKSLYSKEFGTCVAVLARGYRENSDVPTHLALHHVFTSPAKLTETLNKLVDQVGSGPIEIFISGGMEETRPFREQIHKIIEDSQTENCPIKVLDDTFGIADLGTAYICTKSGLSYPVTTGILYAGFTSEHQNPLQIIKANDQGLDIPHSEIDKIMWIPR